MSSVIIEVPRPNIRSFSPASYIDANREEALWAWLSGLEERGMKPQAIPHNSNAGKGMMFPAAKANGEPIDQEYAQTRAHFERAIEMMQLKGNSEVHRKFWSNDEFANFENADSLANYSDRKIAKENFCTPRGSQGYGTGTIVGHKPLQTSVCWWY